MSATDCLVSTMGGAFFKLPRRPSPVNCLNCGCVVSAICKNFTRLTCSLTASFGPSSASVGGSSSQRTGGDGRLDATIFPPSAAGKNCTRFSSFLSELFSDDFSNDKLRSLRSVCESAGVKAFEALVPFDSSSCPRLLTPGRPPSVCLSRPSVSLAGSNVICEGFPPPIILCKNSTRSNCASRRLRKLGDGGTIDDSSTTGTGAGISPRLSAKSRLC
mmetsp:Transcript_14539/g.39905  ORF Transcript_14539/g.39905 Transcript_14539/m.39905 type:complete len:217 (-) Transcript_14539:1606-2256(-)